MTSQPVSASTTIHAPAATIFDILADPRQHSRIDGSGNVRDAVSGPDRLVLGSEFGMGMKMGASYQTANTVVELEEDRLIAWRHKAPHRWRYELEPQADGSTKVTETWDISRWPGPGRAVLRLLLASKTQRAIEATLVKLKAAAEADAA
ncbi:MAG: dimethyladenosine transferase [Actinobacteria bacterium]|uniref:Unannotated protein n=1 Tax=freshwater metagenome TaxID=449393 RepID=A0A6J6NYC2_9ZZZZ|nr:dimethyladenosine transferase [Actinomycetota bacterium]